MKILSERQTCGACPTQYEGELADGRVFYFRYRFGTAMLGIGSTHQAALDATFSDAGAFETLGDPLDGVLDHEEYVAVRDRLLEEVLAVKHKAPSKWRAFWTAVYEILEGTGADLNRGRPLRPGERS